MQRTSIRKRLVATSIMAGAVTMTATWAQAQTPVETSVEGSTVEEVVITGSRIKRAETSTEAPVVIVDPQVMADRGFTQPGQALNQLTSNVPSVPQAIGNGSSAGTGQQFPNLFGLGPGRTLTLVNGRRTVSSAQGLGDRVVDTNTIPIGLLKRIDIVQAGAASVYGSDAIAGVINYVLKDKFEGLELEGQYGESTYGDYPNSMLRATWGKNFGGDRGNVAMDLEWSKTDSLLDYDRPRSNLARTTASNPANTSNTDGIPAITEVLDSRFWEFNYNGLLFSPAPAPVPAFIYSVAGVRQQFSADGASLVPYNLGTQYGIPFSSGGDGFSYRELAALYVGVERYNANLLAHWDFDDHIRLSGEFLFSNVTGTDPYASLATNTILNSAATGSGAFAISRQNPYLTPAVTAILGPGGPPLFMSKAWSDLLNSREGQTETNTYRGLVSLEGDFRNWDRDFYWNASVSHAKTRGDQSAWGIWTNRFNSAIAAVKNSAGTIVCSINADASTANDDPACAPINPFGSGNVSDDARKYVNVETGQFYENTQDDFLATVGGDVISLPAGMSKFSLAYEHREEKAAFTPYAANQRGLTGDQTPVIATQGHYHTNEVSAELLIPVIGGDFTLPGVKAFDLDGSYRWVDNTIAGKEGVWGVGARWQVVDGLTFRGSTSRNFRAPTLDQLFAPSRTSLGPVVVDPCDADRIASGPNPSVRLANCQAEWAAHPGYGALAGFQDPNENFSGASITTGGNSALRNEISDTITYGVVIQPKFIPGLTIIIDRIEVDLKDGLSAFTTQNFLATCYDTNPQPVDACSRFTRNAVGTVITGQTTTFNAGSIKYRGEVYHVDYRFSPGQYLGGQNLGDIELQVETTHTAKLETSVTGFDLTRTDDTTTNPDWVSRFDARYIYGPVRLTYSMYYLPESKVNRFDTIESTPTPHIDSNIRHSVSGSYVYKNYTVRAGVINLTNEEPSFPTRSYGDILGRQWFVALKANF